jgi:hypothetical protein
MPPDERRSPEAGIPRGHRNVAQVATNADTHIMPRRTTAGVKAAVVVEPASVGAVVQ